MNKLLLKGSPASIGTAHGKVKIINKFEDIHSFKEGDVLVTEMTSPLFLPAMAKAAAIVTDIGGQLCHAAITSREFKIPCIVNTTKATQILKDGQEIIVNGLLGEIYED